ncbi:glutathione S-transferase [Mycena maculata]|uniref:Glutathione S-transferase n=1 Tax=Mycena maculata TaxID=230809 RepID=A0AAD7J6Z5_9AGAR|nr:glutathione S-transferase [Mycena maculata]
MASLLKATQRLASFAHNFNPPTRYRYTTMAAKPIMLYNAATPNGRKVSVFLEELKTTYGLEYDFRKLDFSKNEQKEPWFIEKNPNGRIPTIVDRAHGDFAVFETGAILLYLQQTYDKEGKYSFDPATQPKEYSEVLQWMFWANAGLGPMMGQAGHFLNAAPEKIPYGQTRYIDETKRLFGVLEIRLKDHEYLAGDKFSIADINAYPWVAGHVRCGVPSLDEWPSMKSWFDKIAARDATKVGYTIP